MSWYWKHQYFIRLSLKCTLKINEWNRKHHPVPLAAVLPLWSLRSQTETSLFSRNSLLSEIVRLGKGREELMHCFHPALKYDLSCRVSLSFIFRRSLKNNHIFTLLIWHFGFCFLLYVKSTFEIIENEVMVQSAQGEIPKKNEIGETTDSSQWNVKNPDLLSGLFTTSSLIRNVDISCSESFLFFSSLIPGPVRRTFELKASTCVWHFVINSPLPQRRRSTPRLRDADCFCMWSLFFFLFFFPALHRVCLLLYLAPKFVRLMCMVLYWTFSFLWRDDWRLLCFFFLWTLVLKLNSASKVQIKSPIRERTNKLGEFFLKSTRRFSVMIRYKGDHYYVLVGVSYVVRFCFSALCLFSY